MDIPLDAAPLMTALCQIIVLSSSCICKRFEDTLQKKKNELIGGLEVVCSRFGSSGCYFLVIPTIRSVGKSYKNLHVVWANREVGHYDTVQHLSCFA